MDKGTGGPAFPAPLDTAMMAGLGPSAGALGMTLRDYLAAQAMQGYCAGILADGGDWPNRESVSANAYAMADAMIFERAK